MKHIYKFIGLAFAALSFAACGGESSPSTSEDTSTNTPVKVAPSPAPKMATTKTAASSSSSSKPSTMTPLQRGERLFKRCVACHTLGAGQKHKVGPNLYGFFGQTAGARDDFNYSKAMKASEIIWTDETLDAYLAKPRDYIPGNRMSFIGLRKAEDRAAVIEYLKVSTQ